MISGVLDVIIYRRCLKDEEWTNWSLFDGCLSQLMETHGLSIDRSEFVDFLAMNARVDAILSNRHRILDIPLRNWVLHTANSGDGETFEVFETAVNDGP